jgi:hypothetical protein
MKTRRFLSTLTFIAAIPSLIFVIFFTKTYGAPLPHLFFLEKLFIVFSCIIGSILLWKGTKWGYKLSTIGWLVILYGSITSIYVAFQPDTKEATRYAMIAKDGLFLAIGIPVIVILIHDIIRKKA